jgi:hypothetical protein
MRIGCGTVTVWITAIIRSRSSLREPVSMASGICSAHGSTVRSLPHIDVRSTATGCSATCDGSRESDRNIHLTRTMSG